MRRLNALLVSLALAFVVAACGRGGESDLPAIGDTQIIHDFGKHVLGDSPTVLSHMFALRNTSPHVLKVIKTSASCGCTSVKPRSETVGGDDVFELDVVVRVTSAGTRTETASVAFDDGTVQTLAMRFTAVTLNESLVVIGGVALDGKAKASIPVIATTTGLTIVPAIPEFEAPKNVSVSFSGWSLDLAYVPGCKSDYARWAGMIELTAEPNMAVSRSDFLQVNFSSKSHARVSLSGLCGPPPGAS